MKTEEILLPDPMEIPMESIVAMISRLAGLQIILAMRLLNLPAKSNEQDPGVDEEDEFLTTADAARLLNVSEDWVYRRAHRLPFARRLSRKALRFSRAGLLKWRAAKAG
ncbi:MAG TPA: helix-turn-helix domain-containing protein [Acidobacteriota bacterium]|nr:helix-turn-helix domain-containing protein [Acidobacteriota bacterium]